MNEYRELLRLEYISTNCLVVKEDLENTDEEDYWCLVEQAIASSWEKHND